MQERRKEIMRGLKGLPGRTLGRGSSAGLDLQRGWGGREGSRAVTIPCSHVLSGVSRPPNWTSKTPSPGILRVTAGCVSEE